MFAGVPKLNRSELETACEDFSNIINTIEGCTVYKGTLSSGVEIAVASTSIGSLKDWTKIEELAYRKKVVISYSLQLLYTFLSYSLFRLINNIYAVFEIFAD